MPADINGSPKHFLVVVPGIMGSKLRDHRTGKIIWVDFPSIPVNPFGWNSWLDRLLGDLAYPNDNLKPAGIIDDVIFVPPWAKQEQYGRLLRSLQSIGYQIDPTEPTSQPSAYSFAYDWRQDNRISARQLGKAIEGWRAQHPGAKAWVLAHSMGGLMARWYVEQEGGKDHVDRLLLLASPWDGAPKAMHVLFSGFDFLFRRQFNLLRIPERTREVIRTFPSIYQLLPYQNPFLRDVNNELIDPFSGQDWLDEQQQRDLLQDGRRFSDQLGTTTSVETLCLFGRKQLTTTSGLVRSAAGGRWSGIEWGATEAGDGTVPERSAVHAQAQSVIPVAAGHGDIYVHSAVKEMLQWELVDKYRLRRPTRAAMVTERLNLMFTPDRNVYSPGEMINLSASVYENTAEARPVVKGSVTVGLHWRQALPGMLEPEIPRELPTARLDRSQTSEGQYAGSLVAPSTAGYYALRAVIKAIGERPVSLEELIAVDGSSEQQP